MDKAKIIVRLSPLLIMLVVLSGCYTSRKDDPRFAPLIGKTFKTEQELFLVSSRSYYRFDGERMNKDCEFSADIKPTFEEFKTGAWRNREHGVAYIRIVPKGTVIEITDIVKEFNFEMGILHNWYGRFISPRLVSNPSESIDLKKGWILCLNQCIPLPIQEEYFRIVKTIDNKNETEQDGRPGGLP